MKTTNLLFFFLINFSHLSDAFDNNTQCDLLAQKTSEVSIDQLKKTTQALQLYIDLREIEEEQRIADMHGCSWLRSISLSAARGHKLSDLNNTGLVHESPLNSAIDKAYELDLKNYGSVLDKEDVEEVHAIRDRRNKAQKCSACLDYLVARKIVAAYEKNR